MKNVQHMRHIARIVKCNKRIHEREITRILRSAQEVINSNLTLVRMRDHFLTLSQQWQTRMADRKEEKM